MQHSWLLAVPCGSVGARRNTHLSVHFPLHTCLQTVTEKRIRQQLADELGVPMDEHKALVRKHVTHVIEHMDERATLEPLPYTDDEGEEEGGGGKGRKGGGKGKGKGSQEQPHVVVVGAGPAGLAAATVLQVRMPFR